MINNKSQIPNIKQYQNSNDQILNKRMDNISLEFRELDIRICLGFEI